MSISKPLTALIVLAMALLVTAPIRAETALETINREVATIYDRAKYAIVKVHSSRPYMVNERQSIQARRVGTGFFIDSKGTVVTASSVVDQGEAFWIEWDNQKIPMQLVGSDPLSALAVLKVDTRKFPTAQIKTPVLPLGDANELKVGSMVILVGYLYNLPSAPSVGFVGGFDIKCGGHIFATSHIRSTTRLSPGQQGGPLLNVHGEVVGIPVAAHMEDSSFAIPIGAAKRVWTDLLEKGKVDYGWIGVEITEQKILTGDAMAQNPPGAQTIESRVVVTQVTPDTPAARAGLQPGDVIRRIDKTDVQRLSDVLNTMFGFREGDELPITIERAKDQKVLDLAVVSRPSRTAKVDKPGEKPDVSASSTNGPSSLRVLPIVPVSAE